MNGDCVPDIVVGAPSSAQAATVDPHTVPIPRVVIAHGAPTGVFAQSAQLVFSGNGSNLAEVRGQFGLAIAIDPAPYPNVTGTFQATGPRSIFVGEPAPTQRRNVDGTIQNVAQGLLWWFSPQRAGDCSSGPERCGASFIGFGRTGSTLAAARTGDEPPASLITFGSPTRDAAVDGILFGIAVDYASQPSLFSASGSITPSSLGLNGGSPGFGDVGAARIVDLDDDGTEEVAYSAFGLTDDGAAAGVFAFSPEQILQNSAVPVLHWPPPVGVTGFGRSIINAGDLDGDCLDDVAFGSDDGVFLALSSNYADLRRVTAPVGVGFENAVFGASLARFSSSAGSGLVIGAPFRSAGGSNASCATAIGAPPGYVGDCAGAVVWLQASLVAERASGDIATQCTSSAPAGQRLGAALRGLGPAPNNAARARVAVGAPGTNAGQGRVAVFEFGVDCASIVEAATITGSAAGEHFGQSLGQ